MAAQRFVAVFSSNLPSLLAFASQLSPRVEVHPPDAVIIETSARGLGEVLKKLILFSSDLRAGSAATRSAALIAAKMSSSVRVPPGEEAKFLAPFPINLLRLLEDAPWLNDLLDGSDQIV